MCIRDRLHIMLPEKTNSQDSNILKYADTGIQETLRKFYTFGGQKAVSYTHLNGEVLDLMYDVFVLAVQLGGPVLVISMLVGVLISIIQAATQIHEQTITFVPKLLVIGIILVFTGGNMLETLQDFTVRIFQMIQG